jgi:signal transduction histidine kinase
MPEPKVRRASASFQTQGRLLQELGERLVAKEDVALLELIKNAYDADASECRLKFDGNRVEIVDDGHGMTEREFLNNWMHIATPDKQRERISRRYKRKVTGSKGIGRFAVRFLGRHLRLQTIAKIDSRGGKKLLTIDFDWEEIDAAEQLHTFQIPYEVRSVPNNQATGTRLIIKKLRHLEDVQLGKEQKTELLYIVNPYSGLETGDFGRYKESDQDPGFKVILPETGAEEETDLVDIVLRNAYARLTIEHNAGKVKYVIRHKDGRILLRRTINYKSHIIRGFFADIRYCPRRAGMFEGTGVDGRSIYGWLRESGGIGIVDHGFRIRPYGFQDDDWLRLGIDTGHNRREWRVKFMNDLYPMPPGASAHPKLNPMLYLPNFHQLVGAVFVESSQDLDSEHPTDLAPSSDREGFVHNEAFRELFELVRAGLEMLAYADHSEQRRIEEEAARRAVEELRRDYQVAIEYVSSIPTLSETDRQQVITRFETLSRELEDLQEYQKSAISKMEVVALLGVVAGFLTHEMRRLINDLDRIIEEMEALKPSSPVSETLSRVHRIRDEIAAQVQFSATYISNVQAPHLVSRPLNVKSQVKRVLNRFSYFTEERNVVVDIDGIDDELMTPALPVTLYSGILLNLYTNALKAVFGGQGSAAQPRVAIKAWNQPKYHVLEVADTGVGIPPNLRDRIWDPLFTTTSGGSSNPLGSGMGLGLSLVRKLLSDVGARIKIVDPPPGFSTCFRVQFQR